MAVGSTHRILGRKDVVDTAQLDVDLEAEIGQGLGGCFVHVFGLNTLCG